MSWVRRGFIVLATVVSLAFAGDHTDARVRRTDSTDIGPLAVFSVADRVPNHLIGRGSNLVGLRSIPDPLVDVVSLAVAGICLLGLGRRLSQDTLKPRVRPAAASSKPKELRS